MWKLKRFEPKDLIYNTIVAKPSISFIVNSGTVFYQKENLKSGSFGNKVKHFNSGDLSLHEININRPSGSLVYGYIEKDSTRFSYKTISTSQFDDATIFGVGDQLRQEYPMTASVSRIYIPSGSAFSSSAGDPHNNKKYIRSLENVISNQNTFSHGLKFGDLGSKEVNMICIPGIFCGSKIDKGSIQLKYSVTGTLIAEARDIHQDGRLIQVSGTTTGSVVGSVIYNQGILLLTSSQALDSSYQDYYKSTSSLSSPAWVNFGTGIPQVGTAVSHGSVTGSVYTINAKGTHKIPSLTMYTYAKEGEYNYSTNPTFHTSSNNPRYEYSASYYIEGKKNIKKVNKSPYSDHEEDFNNVTYISKVGIYDKDKNLIAIATLANPIKKTEDREFMIKIGIDF